MSDIAALAAAAQAGQIEAIREILQRDPSQVSARSADGWTPLHLSVFFGHPDAARVLLALGADATAVSTNAMANQPIHAGVAGRSVESVRLLLKHPVDVNATQHGGWTPLQAAAQQGDMAMVTMLLERGADPAAASDDGHTARDLAMAHGHHEVAEYLGRARRPDPRP